MLRILHPEVFQGSGRRRRYFEGWYAKHVTKDLSESWSFILGLSLSSKGEAHSIAQVIEGSTGRTWWKEGPGEEFFASPRHFGVRVGGTELSYEALRLDLDLEGSRFEGEIVYHDPKRLPFDPLRPGVMGPYSFLPFMECSHGLLSLDHGLEGSFTVDGRQVHLSGGRGYLEKDWGSSMPSNWIWTQSNNFPAQGDSLMFSLATIPWLGSSFPGFLLAASLGGRLIREATWTGARLEELEVDDRGLKLALRKGSFRLALEVERRQSGILRAPLRGELSRRIAESVDSVLRVRWEKDGRLLFEGEAPKAGLEIAGDPEALASGLSRGLGSVRY